MTLSPTSSRASGGLTLICDTTLSGSQASIDTNTLLGGNIPNSYKHLLLEFSGRSDVAGNLGFLNVRLNNDSGANYYSQHNDASAAVVAAAESLGATTGRCGLVISTGALANMFAASTATFMDYLSTSNFKAWTAHSSGPYNTSTGTTDNRSFSGRWASVAAITRITLLPDSGNFVANTRFTLYGLG